MSFLADLFERLKSWVTWTWTYLWLLWFILVVFLFYVLKGPLKLTENVSTGKFFILHDFIETRNMFQFIELKVCQLRTILLLMLHLY